MGIVVAAPSGSTLFCVRGHRKTRTQSRRRLLHQRQRKNRDVRLPRPASRPNGRHLPATLQRHLLGRLAATVVAKESAFLQSSERNPLRSCSPVFKGEFDGQFCRSGGIVLWGIRGCYCGSPTLRTSSANRGSLRIGSSRKLVFRLISSQSCS
jgi:hypothetical protein